MDNAELRQLIDKKLTEAEKLKAHSDIKIKFPIFLDNLRQVIADANSQDRPEDITLRLDSLAGFVTYDESTSWRRFLTRLVNAKFRSDYFDGWSARGKYLADLDILILKLDALRLALG
ncbi:MAG TPA: hypothetical protein DDY13_12285 [Cytophagales bacterium]|jgi:hypothetical protein|nr:hypothetical protein [Cytophagales bacterium]